MTIDYSAPILSTSLGVRPSFGLYAVCQQPDDARHCRLLSWCSLWKRTSGLTDFRRKDCEGYQYTPCVFVCTSALIAKA